MTRIRLVCTVAFSTFAALALAAGEGATGPSWPGENWEVSTPEREALDAAPIATLDQEIRAGKHGYVDSMLLVRYGRIVFDASYPRDYKAINAPLMKGESGPWNYHDVAWHPYYRGGELHTLQSTTKSFASALAGIAIARSAIRGTDATLGELLPHRHITDPGKAAIRFDSVLTMRPGFEWNEDVSYWDPRNDAIAVERTSDWVAYLLQKPLVAEQGTRYAYNSTNSQMISEIVSTATGKSLEAFAEETLFGPLGIRRYFWKSAPEGYRDAAGGLYLHPRDLARFALLYLRQGEWNGHRVMPAEWVEHSLSTHVADTDPGDPESNTGYGYQWWVFEHGSDGKPRMVGTWGWGGQFALLVPSLDLIAVFTGWNVYEGQDSLSPVRAFYERIVVPTAAR